VLLSNVQNGQQTPYASNGAPIAGITLKQDGANLTDAPDHFRGHKMDWTILRYAR
jgi:hypothetical protein